MAKPFSSNIPHTAVQRLTVVSGAAASGTVTKDYVDYSGVYRVCVAVNGVTIAAAGSVIVQPYVNDEQTALGDSLRFEVVGATTSALTLTVATGTNAHVFQTDDRVFLPFGARVTYAGTGATGTLNVNAFFRLES